MFLFIWRVLVYVESVKYMYCFGMVVVEYDRN